MIERITWLHVSDFHFKSAGDCFSQTVACQALLTDVDARASEHGEISFVLVSGDIAFSGQPAEYERAAEFMSELSKRLSIEPTRFFFIPGNHDVDRALHGFAHLGARVALSSQQAVDQALGDRARMSDLADRQCAYRAFVEGFIGAQEGSETPDGLGYVAAVPLDALTVAVVGLNSAWMCGSEAEENTLIIGERQVISALEIVRALDPQLVIAMAHHPLEWLTEWDEASCRARLLRDVHFLHRGHLHTAEVSISPQRDCVLVAAGSAHASRFYPNSYNILSVDLASGTSLVAEYRYQVLEGTFQPAPVIHTPCELGGEIPGTADEIAGAISAIVPEAGRFARYLAALLLGQKEEIPMVIDGAVMFVPASLAAVSDADQAETASSFLSLRNLLRIHTAGVSLSERIGEHPQRVRAFAAWLSERADMDDDCRERISNLPSSAPESGRSGAPASPHTAALLAELAASEDWELLESQADRALMSSDPVLARLARRMLAQALMHSDDGPKRAQATAISGQLLQDGAAAEDDYMLAAAAFEVDGEPARSVALVGEAISLWPHSARLLAYARDLVTRTGDVSLRVAIEQAAAEVAHE